MNLGFYRNLLLTTTLGTVNFLNLDGRKFEKVEESTGKRRGRRPGPKQTWNPRPV